MTVLADLITAVTNPEHQDADARHAAVTALLDQAPDLDLGTLETDVVAAWNAANGELDVTSPPADLTPEAATQAIDAHMTRMHQLYDLVHVVRDRRQKASTPPPEPEPAPQVTPPAVQKATAPAAAAPPAPETPAATPETTAAETATPDTPAEEPAAEPEPAAPAEPPAPDAQPAAPPDVPAEPAGATPAAPPPALTSPPAAQPEVSVTVPTAAPAAPAGAEIAPVAVAASGAVVATSSTTAVPVAQPLTATDAPISDKSIMDWAGTAFDTAAVTADGGQHQGGGYTITASAGLPNGIGLGETINGIQGLAEAILARTSQLSRGITDPLPHVLAKASAADHARAYDSIQRCGTSTISLPPAAKQFIMRDVKDDETLEACANEYRLPGGSLQSAMLERVNAKLAAAQNGSLTAAIVSGTPGWCALPERRDEFCPVEIAEDLLDLPTVIVPTGSIQYPIQPDFSVLYGTPNLSWCYPHEAYENPAPPDPAVPGPLNKPCIDVPCPQHETTELDPCGICIRARILLATAYPAAVQQFVARALVAWTLRQNCRNIAGVMAKIGAANTITVPQALTGPGATSSILEILEFYRLQLLYRHMLGKGTTMEVLLPLWLRAVIRADISKRQGWDNLSDAVADARIDAMLLQRGIRPQWIRGLSDAYCDPAQTGTPNVPGSTLFGGGANILGTPANAFGAGAGSLWPSTVPMVMYPAGTFVRGRLGLVNIENGLVDSALLSRNERMLLFLEEANGIIKRCNQGLIINAPICASGQTGGFGLTPACGQPVTP